MPWNLKHRTTLIIIKAGYLKLLWKGFFWTREFSVLMDLVEAPVNSSEVKVESAKDSVISRVIHYVQFCWSKKMSASPTFDLYWNSKVELCVKQGYFMKGDCVMIPTVLYLNI